MNVWNTTRKRYGVEQNICFLLMHVQSNFCGIFLSIPVVCLGAWQ